MNISKRYKLNKISSFCELNNEQVKEVIETLQALVK